MPATSGSSKIEIVRSPAPRSPPDAAHGEHSVASELLRGILARHADKPGTLLVILHDLQDELGHIPKHCVPEIADALNLSRAEVHGVVTYYHHFRDHPAARNLIQICRAEACQSMGAEALLSHARKHLECDADGRSKDGTCTVEAAYCLGLCASSPAMFLNGEPHARLTPRALESLVAQARSRP